MPRLPKSALGSRVFVQTAVQTASPGSPVAGVAMLRIGPRPACWWGRHEGVGPPGGEAAPSARQGGDRTLAAGLSVGHPQLDSRGRPGGGRLQVTPPALGPPEDPSRGSPPWELGSVCPSIRQVPRAHLSGSCPGSQAAEVVICFLFVTFMLDVVTGLLGSVCCLLSCWCPHFWFKRILTESQVVRRGRPACPQATPARRT